MGRGRSLRDTSMDTESLHFHTDDVPRLLLDLLSETRWHTYLDLGCGDGALLRALDRRNVLEGKDVFAVDISPSRLARATAVNPRFTCYCSDAGNVEDLSESSIDFLVSTMVLEHMPDDVQMISEVSRLLAPGGTAYLTTVWKKPWAWYYYRRGGRSVLDRTHHREYTEDRRALEAIEDAGMEVVVDRRSLMCFPVLDFVFRRLRMPHVYLRPHWRMLRAVKVPVPGYYCWELVARKPGGAGGTRSSIRRQLPRYTGLYRRSKGTGRESGIS